MSKNTKAGSLRPVISMLILFGPALLLILISTRGCKQEFEKLDDYGKLPAYNFTDKAGKSVKNSDYKNKIVLYTVIQSTCPDTCSISHWHLDQLIYQHLRENRKRMGHVKMVSIVIDSEGNPSDKIGAVEGTLDRFVEGYDSKIWQIVNKKFFLILAIFNFTFITVTTKQVTTHSFFFQKEEHPQQPLVCHLVHGKLDFLCESSSPRLTDEPQ